MRLSHPLTLSLLLLVMCGTVCAQTADDFFNTGAQSYISNNIPGAKQTVESGLKLYPDDVKLKKLEELLNQQSKSQSQSQSQSQQSQQGQNQQGQNQQKNSQQQQNQDQAQQNQDQKDKQNSDQQQQNQQQKDQSQAQNDQDRQKQQDQQGQKDQDQNADQAKEKSDEEAKREAAMMAAGQMTPQQAHQLLDSQKDEEQVLRLAPPNKNTLQNRNFKDW
jgi:hypothetical protein